MKSTIKYNDIQLEVEFEYYPPEQEVNLAEEFEIHSIKVVNDADIYDLIDGGLSIEGVERLLKEQI